MLAAGGNNGSLPLAQTEIFDPASGTWLGQGPLAEARTGHTATLLQNGRVLVAGGSDAGANPMASAELFTPPTASWYYSTWYPTVPLTAARTGQAAVRTLNGSVFAVGGQGSSGILLTAVERYDSFGQFYVSPYPTYGTPYGVVCVDFTVSEAIQTPTVSIGSNSATLQNLGGGRWAAVAQGWFGNGPDGAISFNITAVDLAGNVADSYSTTDGSVVRQDSIAPQTQITFGMPAATNSQSAVIGFSGTDNLGVAGFRGSLDGESGRWVTSPSGFTGLADGSHTFVVYAVDQAGNVALTPASVTWVVDATPPVVTPPADLIVQATDANGAEVTYGLASATDASGPPSVLFSIASGSVFPIGVTTVTAYAFDPAGNLGQATFTVTVTP